MGILSPGRPAPTAIPQPGDDPTNFEATLTLGEGEEGEEDAERNKQNRKAAERQRAASEKALGGAVGAAQALETRGVDFGEIGRISAAQQSAAIQQQQQQLLGLATGQGGGAGELAAQQGLQAQQSALQSAGATAGLAGRSAISSNRQASRAGEQLGLQEEGILQQAALQDQLQAQQLLGQSIQGQQGAGLNLGQLGGQGALSAQGLQQSAIGDLLGQDFRQEQFFQGQDLTRQAATLEAGTQFQELKKPKKGKSGLLGGLVNAVGGAVQSFTGDNKKS